MTEKASRLIENMHKDYRLLSQRDINWIFIDWVRGEEEGERKENVNRKYRFAEAEENTQMGIQSASCLRLKTLQEFEEFLPPPREEINPTSELASSKRTMRCGASEDSFPSTAHRWLRKAFGSRNRFADDSRDSLLRDRVSPLSVAFINSLPCEASKMKSSFRFDVLFWFSSSTSRKISRW